MAIPVRRKPGDAGGSGLGAALGAGLGAAVGIGATIATAGGAAPTIPALASAGATGLAAGNTIGGLAGGAIDPASAQESGIATQDSAISRRLQGMQSGDSLQTIRNGIEALHDLPPELRADYAPPLIQAYLAGVKQRNPNVFGSG